ncbi:MAG: aminotransferase class I/II-fold pyridoxal phosphate-dependent enzyme [Myxococcales bacterium]|nr:aminotransferase class I/II-fold pyridoxal phosphate-dependent enzyme [Myxococcales bacterium]
MQYLIASRRGRPENDPVFALSAEAERRASAGEDIVNATIGALLDDDGALCVMPSVVEALRDVSPRVAAAYAPIAGHDDFRRAVAHDLLGAAGLTDMAVAVATPGGTGALRLAIDNFLESHQALLTGSLYWGPYRTLCEESGRVLSTFRIFDAAGRFDLDDLDRQLGAVIAAQGRALVVLNTPCHNPTGYSLDASELAGVSDVVERHARHHPVVVVHDIAYGYFEPVGLARCLAASAGLVERAMVLFAWSASKSFLQYGLRVGALVTAVPDSAERAVVQSSLTYSCRGMWSNCNAGGMAGVTRVLAEPERRARVVAERAALVALLARRAARWNELAAPAGLKYPRYSGGFFTTVFCRDAPAVAERLRERGVYLVPQDGVLRVALCAVNERKIERVVRELEGEVR